MLQLLRSSVFYLSNDLTSSNTPRSVAEQAEQSQASSLAASVSAQLVYVFRELANAKQGKQNFKFNFTGTAHCKGEEDCAGCLHWCVTYEKKVENYTLPPIVLLFALRHAWPRLKKTLLLHVLLKSKKT